ncbi:hypothetical protein C7271_25490, partial [filamentous cyanobacterium CCP5]
MAPKTREDLLPQSFPQQLDWSPSEAFASLESLYGFVNKECERAIQWYYVSKISKSRIGYLLRAGAIVAVAIAGIIPIIGEICKQENVPCISPAWATVALAVAALLIGLDRFGGYTSGWIRYIRTAQRLNILQGDFRHDWEAHRLERLNQTVDKELTQRGIVLCKSFLQAV